MSVLKTLRNWLLYIKIDKIDNEENIYRRINIISKAQNVILSLITKEIQIIKFILFLAFQISTLYFEDSGYLRQRRNSC